MGQHGSQARPARSVNVSGEPVEQTQLWKEKAERYQAVAGCIRRLSVGRHTYQPVAAERT